MFFENASKWFIDNKKLFDEKGLKIEHVLNHGNNKLEIGVSNLLTKNAGSLELLQDGTCDIMIIDYKSDETLFFDTLYLKNDQELNSVLHDFVNKLSQFK